MKIGLVCPYNVAKGGGVQEQIYAIQAELERRGHQAYIVTPQPRDFTVDARKHIIFIGAATDFRAPFGTVMQLSASVDLSAIDDLLAREKFDILHFHEPGVPVLSRQILSRSTCANVGTFHASFPETLTGRTYTRVIVPYTQSILKYLDELTTVSSASAQHITELTDRPLAIVPNGIDLHYFKSAPKDRKPTLPPKTILYIGRLEGRKGVKYLIKAFKLLLERQPDAKLLLMGDGVDRQKLEDLAEDLELPEKSYEFAGYVSNERKLAALQEATVFCSPALFGESFGIVLTEAMACGVPIVAGNNPGYATVLKGVGSLSLVDPKDLHAFALRLDVMLEEESVRKVWQKWAKEEVQQYSFERVVDEYEKLYRRAIRSRKKAKRAQ